MGNSNITPVVPESDQGDIFSRIVSIIEEARSTVIRTVNSEMVIAYWCIGREIVEEQQAGRERALYGDNLLKKLSEKLTLKFGKGFSVTSLKYFRTCYVTYEDRINCDQSEGYQQKVALSATFSPNTFNQQIFTSRYNHFLPDVKELEIEVFKRVAIVDYWWGV
jgi:hypothetical protein